MINAVIFYILNSGGHIQVEKVDDVLNLDLQ